MARTEKSLSQAVWAKTVEAVAAQAQRPQAVRDAVTFVPDRVWLGEQHGWLESQNESLLDSLDVVSARYTVR